MDQDQGIVDRVAIKEVQHQVVLHQLIQDQQVDNHLVETMAAGVVEIIINLPAMITEDQKENLFKN